ncbi:MAG: arginine repressor [Acidimicrobiales bacterium]|nr:arginine repressor [Acidimicrobiales bacterium]
MTTKRQRQQVIVQILAENGVGSQGQLVKLLKGREIETTQKTVSKDLEELGSVKVRVSGGRIVYAIPELPAEQHLPEDHLRRVLGEWVVEINSSGNIVMMRTPPGSAHVVAAALDRAGLEKILGTVAGDDTIMIVTNEESTGREVAISLQQLAGLE